MPNLSMTSVPPKRRILLVEDDEDTRQLLAVALEAQAYDVTQAGDAEEGLEALRTTPFDMILTDYDLPGKTGAEMLREAGDLRLLHGAATLVVTAHPDPEGVEDSTLIRKPLDLEKFLLKIRRIFESLSVRPVPVPATASASSSRAAEAFAVELTLYISPTSPPSMKARRNMERMIADFPAAPIRFEVLDLAREPERAESDNVVFTPTLVKRRPEPRAWFLGDLSDRRVVADLLRMCGIEAISGR